MRAQPGPFTTLCRGHFAASTARANDSMAHSLWPFTGKVVWPLVWVEDAGDLMRVVAVKGPGD